MPPAVLPSAAALPAFKVPALTLVVPVYVLAPDKVRIPAPSLVSAVALPEMTPLTAEVPATLIEIAPPPVARLPSATPPPLVKESAPPAVWMVLAVSIEMPPAPATKDTELPLVCCRFSTPLVRVEMVMLLVACSTMLVVALMPSISDW